LKAQTWLVLPDLQWRLHGLGHDERSLKAVLKYASEHRWDGVLQLGDFADWDFISKWTAENARRIEGQRFLKEYEGMNKFLDRIQKAARNKNPDAKIVIIQGNHDYRVEVVMDKTPMYEGMLEMETNLKFKERKIEYWKYWEHRKSYKIGKARFIHGLYTNGNHAKTTATQHNHNIYYGHTHDRQLYSKTTEGKTIHAESLGTLSKFELSYMGSKPSNWSQAFAIFYFRPNGTFNHYVIDIINHEFTSPEGKEYKG
jgi:predicted phosphodiesterase